MKTVAYKKTEKEIHALEELLDTFDIYTLEKEFYTLFEIKDVIEKIKPDLYYIELVGGINLMHI